ncbi:transposase family protein [Nonomuraea thailandensis]|uniref:transposase family protein n=1 Tax=Nonomuraea thailandensis TaxID=1188745 RepID=UPI003556D6EC
MDRERHPDPGRGPHRRRFRQELPLLCERALCQHRPARPAPKTDGTTSATGQEEDNAEHRRIRALVEHTFARMKNYKILRDCRQRGSGLHHAVQAVAHMHDLALPA